MDMENHETTMLIEEFRSMNELAYRESNLTAVAVAVLGIIDYEKCPTIQAYNEKGYKLIDANAFGFNGVRGEILIFGQ